MGSVSPYDSNKNKNQNSCHFFCQEIHKNLHFPLLVGRDCPRKFHGIHQTKICVRFYCRGIVDHPFCPPNSCDVKNFMPCSLLHHLSFGGVVLICHNLVCRSKIPYVNTKHDNYVLTTMASKYCLFLSQRPPYCSRLVELLENLSGLCPVVPGTPWDGTASFTTPGWSPLKVDILIYPINTHVI